MDAVIVLLVGVVAGEGASSEDALGKSRLLLGKVDEADESDEAEDEDFFRRPKVDVEMRLTLLMSDRDLLDDSVDGEAVLVEVIVVVFEDAAVTSSIGNPSSPS